VDGVRRHTFAAACDCAKDALRPKFDLSRNPAVAVLIVIVKGIDIALSLPRGLAWTVAVLAVCNAFVAGAVAMLILPETTNRTVLAANLVHCAASALRNLIETASSGPIFTTLIVLVVVVRTDPARLLAGVEARTQRQGRLHCCRFPRRARAEKGAITRRALT
jgi:glycerol uptake facilitator-like aquaporin